MIAIKLIRRPNSAMRPREHLTEREIEKLLTAARGNRWGQRDSTMILLCFRHGLRASELTGLQWSDIEFESATLHLRRAKGGITATHLLLGDELRALRNLKQKPAALKVPSEDPYALAMRVVDCENKAANRYDDGNSTISSLAHQIMMICQPEILKLHLAYRAAIPLDDPEWDLHEFKHALDIAESERKSRASR